MPLYRFSFGVCSFIIALFLSSELVLAEEPNSQDVWKSLFDGKTLNGWDVPKFGGDGEVSVKDGKIVIGQGAMMTGIKYKKAFPKTNYEIRYEAKRTEGGDFFAALTFPVAQSHCTFVNGGWGGGMVGLSSINGMDASENQTGGFYKFSDDTWYRFRIRVTDKEILAWISHEEKDKETGKTEWKERNVVSQVIENVEISLRLEMTDYVPLGICTWLSEGMVRKIEYRELTKEELQEKKK